MTDPKLKPGTRFCLCRSCGRYFGGVNGFDLHRRDSRVGRICLDPASVVDKQGYRKLWLNDRGFWVGDYPERAVA